jgi:uncharacterized protein YhfF
MTGTSDRSRYVTPLGPVDPDAVAAFWQPVVAAGAVPMGTPQPPAHTFGDTVELADELIDLVLAGTKRATAAAVADHDAAGDPLPAVGDLWIATDGARRPRALLETTDVRVGPLSSVDDRFAWDEGEGDRTRAWWLAAPDWDFSRTFAAAGRAFHLDIPVVFERFTVRHPRT